MTTRTATFPITLSQSHPIEVNINYATENLTAMAGKDYTPISGTLVFNPGEISKTLDITIQAISDRNLNFIMRLSTPKNCTLTTQNSGNATIMPDNALVILVNAAKAAATAYNNALLALETSKTQRDTALSNYNSATTTYNSYVTEQTSATNDYNSAVANLNNKQNDLNNAGVLYALGSISAGTYLAYVNARNAAQDQVNAANSRLQTANANVATWLTNKNNAYNTYQTAIANVATKQAAADAAFTAKNNARDLAAAGFVGSTTLTL